MNTTFSYGVRMLMCNNCGAPLQVAPTGGQIQCNYCQAVNQVGGRDERSTFAMAPHAQMSEPERLVRLRSQDGKPLMPPASIASLFGPGGQIPAWKLQEVLAVWQSTRNELRQTGSYDAGERLLFLSMALSNVFAEQQDHVRQRALFESAYEVFNLPRHRQMMLGLLSRNAARLGDLASAERWLSLCDPQSDDLSSDTAYRMSVAYVYTARGNWQGVLQTLGGNSQDVPILDAFDILAAILRANAWEKMGQLPAAVAVLGEALQRSGAQGREAIEKTIALCPEWQLCPASFPQATAQYGAVAGRTAAAHAGGGVGTFLVGFGILMLLGAVGAVIAGASGGGIMGYSWALGPGIAGVVMLSIGLPLRKAAKRAERLRLHGKRAQGQVLAVQPTGVSINNVPQFLIQVMVQLEGVAPYPANIKMLLNPASLSQLAPGAALPLRVDPASPQDVIIEAD
jgi:LSD1 subclass zinc finger protein